MYYSSLIKIFLLLSILLLWFNAPAQINIDSLNTVIESEASDEDKLQAYLSLIKFHRHKDESKVYQYAQQIYTLKNVSDPNYAKAQADYYTGHYFKRQGKFDKAKELFTTVAEYGKSFNKPTFYGSAITNLAIINNDVGDNDAAIELYYELLQFNNQNDHQRGNSHVYNNIARVYEVIKDYEQALSNYKKGYELATKYKEPQPTQVLAGNIAGIYIIQGTLDSAEYYAKITLDTATAYQYTGSKGYADLLLSEIYFAKKDYQLATSHAESAIKQLSEYGDQVLITDANTMLAKINKAKGNYLEAIQVANKNLIRAEKINYINGQINNLFTLSETEKLQGNYQAALHHRLTYDSLMDSISALEDKKSIRNLEAKFNTAQKDVLLAEQNLQIEKQKVTRNQLLAGLGVLSLLSFIYLRYRQNLNKKNIQLKEKQIQNLEQKQKLIALDFMVQGQEVERKRIAQDLHDGLGGLLSTARLQLQNIQKEVDKFNNLQLIDEAEFMINNACTEVRRIAHDMMPTALTDLGLKDAVEDLAEVITTQHKIEVVISDKSYNLSLSENQKVQIYRAIQEILQNAVKHSQASIINIDFTVNEDSFIVSVKDNGIGFDYNNNHNYEGLGIKGIRSRIQYLNGLLKIKSQADSGTIYVMQIPILES